MEFVTHLRAKVCNGHELEMLGTGGSIETEPSAGTTPNDAYGQFVHGIRSCRLSVVSGRNPITTLGRFVLVFEKV
jgi:hypothetical protein